MTKATLLVDADTLLYRAVIGAETYIEWSPDVLTWECDLAAAERIFEEDLAHLTRKLPAEPAIVLCLSDPADNFRKHLDPTYKAGRGRKPPGLGPFRARVVEKYRHYIRPGLEGDDVAGILATSNVIKGTKIVYSADKDLLQIPGPHLNKDGEVFQITEEAADRHHMLQTLTGDATDGYPGCPGVGPKKAAAILDDADCPFSPWSRVSTTFMSKGLTYEDALLQARLARILRATDYDFSERKPILWTPPQT